MGIISSFLSHVVSVRPQPGGTVWIQSHGGYVTGNWVHMEMTHTLLLTAVNRNGLRLGSVVADPELLHQSVNVFQSVVSWEMAAQKKRL